MVNIADLEATFRVRDKGTEKLDGIEARLKGFGGAIQVALGNIASRAFRQLGDEIWNMIELSEDASGVQEGFQKQVEDSEGFLRKLEKATNEEATAFELMRTANLGLLAGMNTTQLEEMAKVSEILGETLGVKTAKAFDDLVTGIARGSPKILDNLGLFVESDKAMQAYADELGTTKEEMSRFEKMNALLNATMEEADRLSSELGSETDNLGDKSQQADKQINDLKKQIGDGLAPEIVDVKSKIGDAAGAFSDFMADPNVDSAIDFFNSIAVLVDKVTTGPLSKAEGFKATIEHKFEIKPDYSRFAGTNTVVDAEGRIINADTGVDVGSAVGGKIYDAILDVMKTLGLS